MGLSISAQKNVCFTEYIIINFNYTIVDYFAIGNYEIPISLTYTIYKQ